MPKVSDKKSVLKMVVKDAVYSEKKVENFDGRQIKYPEVEVRVLTGDHALTAAKAKELIGWREEGPDEKFDDYDLVDARGRRVKLLNNPRNRPFDRGLAATWKSEVLCPGTDGDGKVVRTRWKLNGENLIIGRTGVTISAQHRLVGLITAAQEWAKDPTKWPNWAEEPVMECLIAFGIDESDATVNTIDTGKPRTLADVICRSEFFSDVRRGTGERLKMAKIVEFAVRWLYSRTGAGADALTTRRTHAESLDFISRHPKLLECVRHVHDEDGGEGLVHSFVSRGYASALLYLMGSSTTDPKAYLEARCPTEELLDWKLWETACDFWTDLAASNKRLAAVRTVLGRMMDDDVDNSEVRAALAIRAWHLYSKKKAVTADLLQLKFHTSDNEVRTLVDPPLVGGIDVGSHQHRDEVAAASSATVTPDDVELEKVKIRKENDAKKRGPARSPKLQVDDHVWVAEDGGHWEGTLLEIYAAVGGKQVARVEDSKGNIYESAVGDLTNQDPNA
jgi:hypothetical protein